MWFRVQGSGFGIWGMLQLYCIRSVRGYGYLIIPTPVLDILA